MSRAGVQNAILICTGKKGSGKTTLIRKLEVKCRRSLVCDPEAKWPPARAKVIYGARELLKYARAHQLQDPARPFRIIYRDDVDAMQLAGPGLAFVLRRCTLTIDELAWLCNSRQLPTYLRRILQFGRERQINLMGTTREPQEVHDLLFSQADEVVFFRTDPGNGLDRIRRRYGPLADELPGLASFKSRTYGSLDATAFFGREGT